MMREHVPGGAEVGLAKGNATDKSLDQKFCLAIVSPQPYGQQCIIEVMHRALKA